MKIIIAGASGAGLKVVQVIHDLIDSGINDFSIIGFVDDNKAIINSEFFSYPILGTPEMLLGKKVEIDTEEDIGIVCPVGNPFARKKMIDRLSTHYKHFPNVIHPSAQISKNAVLGQGNLFSQNIVIQPGAKIGNFNTFNIASIMGPLSEVKDYCTINANVMIASESKVNSFTYIGMGANIIQRVTIGEHCTIAGNSFVTRNLPDNTKVIGIPAKRM